MTLQEAHEIQRKELISLRRENEKLKKGIFSSSEKETLEKKLRMLEKENADLKKNEAHTKELLRESQRQISDLHDKNDVLTAENERLNRELYSAQYQLSRITGTLASLRSKENSLSLENNELKQQLETVQTYFEKLKIQVNRDHDNSSIPSSKERFPKKIRNSREHTGRKPGAQQGHSGAKRPHMEPTCPVIDIPAPSEITSDPDYYATGKYITKQVIDLHVSVSVTEYRTPEYRSRSTGKRVHAAFPGNLQNEFSYGQNIKALAFLLNNYCNVAIDKVSEIISGISDGKIRLSKGLINDLPRQFSDATKQDRDKIYQSLLKAPVMYSDATPCKVNGKTVQVYTSSNPDEVLYTACQHKGFEGLDQTPVAEYLQTVVHDHDKTYYHYGSAHQECLSHVLRYLENAMENEPDLHWSYAMKALLRDMIHTFKQDHSLTNEQISFYEDIYAEILLYGKHEYELHPPNKYFPDGFNLLQKMTDYAESHLYFLRHPEVEYSNNRSERNLRKVKRKMHQVVTFRSFANLTFFCEDLSMLETWRLYQTNIFSEVAGVFAGV